MKWVCEDCLSDNLEKNNNDIPLEWINKEDDLVENYCLDCESFTIKIKEK